MAQLSLFFSYHKHLTLSYDFTPTLTLGGGVKSVDHFAV